MNQNIQVLINDLDTDEFNEFRSNILAKFNIKINDHKVANPHPIFGCFTRSEIQRGLNTIEEYQKNIQQELLNNR